MTFMLSDPMVLILLDIVHHPLLETHLLAFSIPLILHPPLATQFPLSLLNPFHLYDLNISIYLSNRNLKFNVSGTKILLLTLIFQSSPPQVVVTLSTLLLSPKTLKFSLSDVPHPIRKACWLHLQNVSIA